MADLTSGIPGFLVQGQAGIVVGPNREVNPINNAEDKIKRNALRMGGVASESVHTKKGIKRKPKKLIIPPPTEPTDSIEFDELPPELQFTSPMSNKEQVFFHNAFGKIKLKVEKVLYKEIAIALMFSRPDDVVFEPNTGEQLKLTTDLGEYNVMYPGTLFDLPFGERQLMVLYIKDEIEVDNQ